MGPDAAIVTSLARNIWRTWARGDWDNTDIQRKLCEISDKVAQVFVYEIRGRDVSIVSKHNIDIAAHSGRAVAYQKFLTEIVGEWEEGDLVHVFLGIDLDDGCCDWRDIPIFSFQKPREFRNPLMPDIDFLASDFYASCAWGIPDMVSYRDKHIRAVFAGSTTGGGLIRRETISDVPRIKSARFFQLDDRVDFSLTKIVQCADADVEAALKREGFGGDAIGWPEQLSNRFVMSIDGNGATCSRVFIALKSHSALLKYESNYELFYFSLLTPWVNYAPIYEDSDVIDILNLEERHPGFFEPMAAAGEKLAELLSRENVKSYASELLRIYISLLQ